MSYENNIDTAIDSWPTMTEKTHGPGTTWPKYRIMSLFIFLFCLGLSAGDVVGVVLVVDKKEKLMDLKDERVIVYLEGKTAPIPNALLQKKYTISARNKQFEPRVLAVPKGASVHFPNSDPIIHNVFSVSGKNRFDAGRYGRNESATHTFKEPGMVRIYCNVHHHMNAVIYVADNPWFSYAESNGAFILKDVPPGDYRITAIHRVAGKKTMDLTVGPGQTSATLKLTARTKKLKKHMNKHGKPYKKRRSEKY